MNMTKKITFVLLAVLACIAAAAQTDNYKILYINTPAINIGGKQLGRGDEFPASATINWSSEKQAMRVVSTTTNRQLTLSPRVTSGKKSLAAYLSGRKALATRPGYPASIPELRSELPSEIDLLDRHEVYTSLPVDDVRFFYASYTRDGEEINKILPALAEGGFCIDRTLWEIDGEMHAPVPTEIAIFYYDTAAGTVAEVATGITINPLNESGI